MAAVGAKLMLTLTVPPTGKTYGVVTPVTEKPAPLTVIWLIVALTVPLLINVSALVLLDPVFTVPKAINGLTIALCAIADFVADKIEMEMHTRIATTGIRLMSFCLSS